MRKKSTSSETIFDAAGLKEIIRKAEKELEEESFWKDNAKTQDIFLTLNRQKGTLAKYEALLQTKENLSTYFELLNEETPDPDLLSEIPSVLSQFKKEVDEAEIDCLLSGEYDTGNCIISLNAGAGGTDAQDWTQILYRMFLRWMEKKKFTFDVVTYMPGEEAGIKSAVIRVVGPFAYGLLKNEIGIHRLVRLSPFNASNKRQTSFAAVDVIPEIPKDFKNITLRTEDLKIDTFRASGAGGQHVNKTDSAVRITHLPTGIVAQSQASRSQGANKEVAMQMLTSRLVQQMELQHKETLSGLRGESKEIAWGHQIRSYVFHPYKLVKDHRTNIETSNVDEVLDGGLDPFIHAHLRQSRKKQ